MSQIVGQNFEDQFKVSKSYYLERIDFLNWFRYFHLVRDVLDLKAGRILEIGTGSGIVCNCIKPLVDSYHVLDINGELEPDFIGDVREFQPALESGYDCVIAADVLEHLPFSDFRKAVGNLHAYLEDGGNALFTIPHRQSNFLFMDPRQIPYVITVPTGFLSFGAFWRRFVKRKIWIDPSHCWEIGDGKVKVKDVDAALREVGFEVVKFDKLLYVDYWVLKKGKNRK